MNATNSLDQNKMNVLNNIINNQSIRTLSNFPTNAPIRSGNFKYLFFKSSFFFSFFFGIEIQKFYLLENLMEFSKKNSILKIK